MRKIKTAAAFLAAVMLMCGCRSGAPAETVEVHNTAPAVTSESTAAELEKYVVTCAEVAYRTVEDHRKDIPEVMEVTDDVMISDVLQYDMELADDFSVYMQLISTDLFELTVIRPKEGNENDVLKMLEARQTYLREQAAYYPAQVAAAEASRVGQINGVFFLVCCENAEDLVKSVMYYVLRN